MKICIMQFIDQVRNFSISSRVGFDTFYSRFVVSAHADCVKFYMTSSVNASIREA